MNGEGWLFLFSLLLSAGLVFFAVYFIMMFSDLECDYINPADLCNRLNAVIIPENTTHAALALLFILCRQWTGFILNVPLVVWNAKRFVEQTHWLDATSIYRSISRHKKESFARLAFYLLSFFYYLYRMILALMQESE